MQFKKIALVGAAIIPVAASFVGDANATWYRTHGSACFGVDPDVFNSYTLFVDNGYSIGNGNTSAVEMMCSVPDSSVLPRNQFRTVNVETWVGGTGIINSAALCEDQWNGDGGSCTELVSSTGTGHQELLLGGLVGTAGTWTPGTVSNFGYIGMSVGGGQGVGQLNNVRGIYYSN
jgi:hypothetical protein